MSVRFGEPSMPLVFPYRSSHRLRDEARAERESQMSELAVNSIQSACFKWLDTLAHGLTVCTGGPVLQEGQGAEECIQNVTT